MKSEPGSSRRPDLPLVVIVGAGGLGMAVARRLGQSYRILLADRDKVHLERMISDLQTMGFDANGIPCDVTRAEDIDGLAKAAIDVGPARALAYVVGLSPSLGNFRSILEVNLIGAARTLQAFHGNMTIGGAAVCIASSAAHMQQAPEELLPLIDAPLMDTMIDRLSTTLADGATPAAAYVLSKQGLVRLCQRSASGWGQSGSRVVSLSPGLIATPQGAIEHSNSPGKRGLFDRTPLGREATMVEIAGIVDFLLSDAAAYVNGVDLLVDGGLIADLKSI